jgi:hypothetical protein
MVFYSTPSHATKRRRSSGLKQRFYVTQVQDCNSLTRQQKLMLWNGSPPLSLSLMFFVYKANGDRVLLAADTRISKRNWVNILSKINFTEVILHRPSNISLSSFSSSSTNAITSTSIATTTIGSSTTDKTSQEDTLASVSIIVPSIIPTSSSTATTSCSSSRSSSRSRSEETNEASIETIITTPTDSSNQVLVDLEEASFEVDDICSIKSDKAIELSPITGDSEEEEEEEEEERLSDGVEGNNKQQPQHQ